MNRLDGKTVIVGVCGGIAAYKTCSLVSKLTQLGADVHVVMTAHATEFVAPLTFETLAHNRVTVDMFDRNFAWETKHISLAKKADLMVVAPATANVIAKLACGIADDFLTTVALACRCKIMFAPAMNTAMLQNPATEKNISELISRGFIPVFGDSGYLACGDRGSGRMAEPEALTDAVISALFPNRELSGKTVLVTAGATRAYIDPVRFICNRSSGKMGYAVARAAFDRGAKIIFVAGITDKFDIPAEWTTERVTDTEQMAKAVAEHSRNVDIAIMAAAPCDYTVSPAPQKIKSDSLTLELKKTVDIAAEFGRNKKPDAKLVIFAAETENCVENARKKLANKKADMVVLNDVTREGAGFDVDTNAVTIITADGEREYPLMSKRDVAEKILDSVSAL